MLRDSGSVVFSLSTEPTGRVHIHLIDMERGGKDSPFLKWASL
jgi:hypothetical protein